VDINEVKDKIRKLLALGTDNDQEHEINNALKFARRLMLEHNISKDDVTEKPVDPHEKAASLEYDRAICYSEGKKFAKWEFYLGNTVKILVGSVHFIFDSSGQSEKRNSAGLLIFNEEGNTIFGQRAYFVGPLHEAAEAEIIFKEWRAVIISLARLKYGTCLRGKGRSYAEGFTKGLFDKVYQELKVEGKQENTNEFALIRQAHQLMQAKKAVAERWFFETYGRRLQTNRVKPIENDREAYGTGFQDGRRAEISRKNQAKRITG
jgi:hypothetical protein